MSLSELSTGPENTLFSFDLRMKGSKCLEKAYCPIFST